MARRSDGWIFLAVMILSAAIACGGGEEGDDDDDGPAFDADAFQTDVDNDYFPLIPSTDKTFEGTSGANGIEIRTSVLPDTENVAGVECTVLQADRYVNEKRVEVSFHWFAQQIESGGVYQFGRRAEQYENGTSVGFEGTWKVGEDAAAPVLVFPGDPELNDIFYGVGTPPTSGENAKIVVTDGVYSTTVGDFTETIEVEETGEETVTKIYAPGEGLVGERYEDGGLALITIQ
ncbi:MAG: hypothetical protein M5R36_27685 [Deltaproteobacteria bacterium]|nr:hypothetical protein [Deltaproteobacteria bacterium]